MKKIFPIFVAAEPYLALAVLYIGKRMNWAFLQGSKFTTARDIIMLLAVILSCILLSRTLDPAKEVSKWAMIIKLVHIPYYVLIFLVGMGAAMVGLIPIIFFTVMGIGTILILFIMDLLLMLQTSFLNFTAIYHLKKANRITGGMAWALVIFSCIFCADVVIAIVLRCLSLEKKNQAPYPDVRQYQNPPQHRAPESGQNTNNMRGN